jgi:hypothetical protein
MGRWELETMPQLRGEAPKSPFQDFKVAFFVGSVLPSLVNRMVVKLVPISEASQSEPKVASYQTPSVAASIN